MSRRIYEKLFNTENVSEVEDWLGDLNSESLQIVTGSLVSPKLREAKVGDKFQIERVGYFCVDQDSTSDLMVLNRTCSLKESVFTKSVRG